VSGHGNISGQFVAERPRGTRNMGLSAAQADWPQACSANVVAATRSTSRNVPAPTGRLAFPILDHRAEPRFVCRGKLEITFESPDQRRLEAELTDISNHGFRIIYQGELLSSGTEFAFRHQFFQGRARLMWSHRSERYNEGGCLVIRD
jgi:hypothetical protein